MELIPWVSFHQQIGLKFEEQRSKVLHLEHCFVCCWELDTSESVWEILGNFWSEVLENGGEDKLDRLCEKWIIIIWVKDDRNIVLTIKGEKLTGLVTFGVGTAF